MKPDSAHQQALEQASQQSEDELRRRLAVKDYKDARYLPPEVLVSFVKLGFGRASGLLDAIGAALHAHILQTVRKLLKTMMGALRGGDSVVEDATSAVWDSLLDDDAPVGESFSEVRFAPYVEARLRDYLRHARSQQGDAVLFGELDPQQVDGEELAFENTLAGDVDDQPENELERKQLKEQLTKLLAVGMPTKEKLAVYFRIELDYTWKKTAEMMGCSIPTATRYYELGKQRLLGELDDGLENDR